MDPLPSDPWGAEVTGLLTIGSTNVNIPIDAKLDVS